MSAVRLKPAARGLDIMARQLEAGIPSGYAAFGRFQRVTVLRKIGVCHQTPCGQCSVMFLNPAQFDANSTANPSVELPPVVTPNDLLGPQQPLLLRLELHVSQNAYRSTSTSMKVA